MLNFRTRRSFAGKNNYLGSQFQRKLLGGFLVILVIVIVVGQVTGTGPSFSTIFGKSSAWNKGKVEDNRIDPAPHKTDPDAVVVPLPADAQPVAAKKLFAGVEPKLFTELEDDAVYRRAEDPSFFELLKVLSESDDRDLRLASTGLRTFRQLQDQSADYRGEIVTIAGHVRRIIPQTKPSPNTQGIKKFYEVWFEPIGNRLPIVVVCTELPDDYPLDKAIEVDAEASGFFYKRLGYASAEMTRVDKQTGERNNVYRSAPLVLAKTLRWKAKSPLIPSVVPEQAEGAPSPLPFGIPSKYVFHVIGVGAMLMLLASVWSFRLSRSSVVSRGPIVGRARRAAAEAEAEANRINLNQLKIDP